MMQYTNLNLVNIILLQGVLRKLYNSNVDFENIYKIQNNDDIS